VAWTFKTRLQIAMLSGLRGRSRFGRIYPRDCDDSNGRDCWHEGFRESSPYSAHQHQHRIYKSDLVSGDQGQAPGSIQFAPLMESFAWQVLCSCALSIFLWLLSWKATNTPSIINPSEPRCGVTLAGSSSLRHTPYSWEFKRLRYRMRTECI